MRIAFCSAEVVPFAKTGGLADVCGELPLALEKLGEEIVIIMPRYQCINAAKHSLKAVNKHVSKARIGDRIQVYFIEHADYYQRDGLYGNARGEYPDNLKRFQFYCFKACELLKQLNLKIEIIHLHDWQTALMAAYLKILYRDDPYYQGIKSILTIHNMAFQGIFPAKLFPELGVDRKYFNINGF